MAQGRLARIDSQNNPYFHNVPMIRENHLKPAICKLKYPEPKGPGRAKNTTL